MIISLCPSDLHTLQDVVKYFTDDHKATLKKGCVLWNWSIEYYEVQSGINQSTDENQVKKRYKIIELFNKWYIFMFFTHILLLIAVITKIVAEYNVSCYFYMPSQQSTYIVSLSMMIWWSLIEGTNKKPMVSQFYTPL